MSDLKNLLQESDPLRTETEPSDADRNCVRQAIMKAASERTRISRSRLSMPAYISILLIAAALFSAVWYLWSPSIHNVQAAVRFEVRLAEDSPAVGLTEAREAAGERVVYLHNEVIVANSDIEEATVLPQSGGSQYEILIRFNPAAGQKMHEITQKNIGKRMAILIDGELIAAPLVRGPTAEFAKIDAFSKDEAERIAAGMLLR